MKLKASAAIVALSMMTMAFLGTAAAQTNVETGDAVDAALFESSAVVVASNIVCVGVTNNCRGAILCVGVTNNCKGSDLCLGVTNNCRGLLVFAYY